MTSKKRYKVFRSSLKWLAIYSIIPVIIALVLINVGRNYAQVFAADQTKQILLGYLPFGLGIFTIFCLVLAFFNNVGRAIVITPLTIALKHGRHEKILSWDNIIFRPPTDSSKRFKKVLVSNGRQNIAIEEFYFPDFEVIVGVIKAAKESRKSSITI